MIGEVAAFAIDDIVKELRCIAAMGYGSAEWKKCACLQEQYPDKACGWCEYEHKDSNVSYDPDIANALCSLAADEIEMLRGRAERAEAALKAAEDDIRELLLHGEIGHEKPVCYYCAVEDANECIEHGCEKLARWRGLSEESEEEHD